MSDLFMQLCTEEYLDLRLPIDEFLTDLDEKGVLSDTDDNKKLLRSAIFTAWQHSWRGPQLAGKIQLARKNVPADTRALIVRTEKILELYAEIATSFDGRSHQEASYHIEQGFRAYFPHDKKKADSLVSEWRFRFVEFMSFEKILRDFKTTLQIGVSLAEKPKRGPSKQSTYFFVSALAVEWFKITAKPPTRVFDPAKDRETGLFYDLCMAAALTVKDTMPFGSIDAAARAVCDQWKVHGSREDLRDLWWDFEPRGPIKLPKSRRKR